MSLASFYKQARMPSNARPHTDHPAATRYTRHEVTAPRVAGPSGRTPSLIPKPSKNLHHHLHLHQSSPWQRAYPHRRPHMPPRLSKHLHQQIRSPVHHLRRIKEPRRGVHIPIQANHALHPIQRPQMLPQYRQLRQRASPSRGIPLLHPAPIARSPGNHAVLVRRHRSRQKHHRSHRLRQHIIPARPRQPRQPQPRLQQPLLRAHSANLSRPSPALHPSRQQTIMLWAGALPSGGGKTRT